MRKLGSAIGERLWAFSRPRLPRLVYTNGGLGDELMLTAIARVARAAGSPLHILTSRPEVWRDNGDPASVQIGVERWFYAQRRGWIGTEIVHLAYKTGAPGHIGAQMAARAGFSLPGGWRPFLVLLGAARREPNRIVVQNSCRGAIYAATTKEWAQARWQELVNRLAVNFEVVQIGTSADPLLNGVIDRRGRTTLHNAAAVIRDAACFVGLESGLMHVAAAVKTPSVIIYGGRSRPHETGYAFNRNLTRQPACVGCGLNDGCPHQMICMDIPVSEVETAVHDAMNSNTSNA